MLDIINAKSALQEIARNSKINALRLENYGIKLNDN